ncbi:3-oxoacyl-(Acyl-carrier protein) reductase [Nostocoides japonicum T1-X7]|uniref:3-oxoacyl-(Acyl-carrier protein) reductase n=1 Tax=Nostocoides japonicum T1-X7 TaxID=1194083 RepID=A0A077M1A2_9MICO|nr:SDR family oxidoreductase [Tetrasphaera japonica]CCH79601.1 3-oxoacyl-(Acyl-carrier protein) reductase [Tetrasphaera japonica T1-X7]
MAPIGAVGTRGSTDTDGARGTAGGRRVALVTGGSRGIGAATVRALHRDGFDTVVHCGHDERAANALVAELGSERATVIVADLTDPDAYQRLWREAVGWRGRIDVLVNNAGAWIGSPLENPAGWMSGWEVNIALHLLAPANLCREAVLFWTDECRPDRPPGIVINLASRSSHRGDDADHLAYGATKGGILALTKGIARAYAPDVLAYAIAPGWVATDLVADTDLTDIVAGLPMREMTPAKDVAEVIAFLASGRSPHTTGATIDITGADYVR